MARKTAPAVSKERAKELIELNLAQMLLDLQIHMWNVTIVWDEMPKALDSIADVTLSVDYKNASIRWRLSLVQNERHFLDTLLHELIHIVLAPYDVYSDLMYQYCKTDTEQNQHSRIWVHTSEIAVWNFEQVFHHGLKYVYPMYRTGRSAPVCT